MRLRGSLFVAVCIPLLAGACTGGEIAASDTTTDPAVSSTSAPPDVTATPGVSTTTSPSTVSSEPTDTGGTEISVNEPPADQNVPAPESAIESQSIDPAQFDNEQAAGDDINAPAILDACADFPEAFADAIAGISPEGSDDDLNRAADKLTALANVAPQETTAPIIGIRRILDEVRADPTQAQRLADVEVQSAVDSIHTFIDQTCS